MPLLSLLIAMQATSLREVPVWIKFHRALKPSPVIQVRWTLEAPEGPTWFEEGAYVFTVFRGGGFLLDKVGKGRLIWNGRRGLALDDVAKTYGELLAEPYQHAGYLFALTPSSELVETRRCQMVESRTPEVIHLGADGTDVDTGWHAEWDFDRKTFLPFSALTKLRHETDRPATRWRHIEWNLHPNVDMSVLSLTPPKGYKPE